MTTIELAYHIKEVRDLQKAYFASRNGRYADKKLLVASKAKEKELDVIVESIIPKTDVIIIDDVKKEIDFPSFFEKNAIFGDEFDVDPYQP